MYTRRFSFGWCGSLAAAAMFTGACSGDASTAVVSTNTEVLSARATDVAVPSPNSVGAPVRPASGAVTRKFAEASADGTHNGVDYANAVGVPVLAPGSGPIHSFTRPDASGFGSFRPSGAGPAVWMTLTMRDGSPVYAVLGHCADSWTDNTTGIGTNAFAFKARYSVKAAGTRLIGGQQIAMVAPVYYNKRLASHVHVGFFRPKRDALGNYFGPPTSGWGYSAIKLTTGEWVDPNVVYASYRVVIR